jgi:hypothetical protein
MLLKQFLTYRLQVYFTREIENQRGQKMEEKTTRLITEREAAEEYFGWSIEKMRKVRKSGEIEFYQFNDQVIKYSVEQLEAYKNRFLKQAAAAIRHS